MILLINDLIQLGKAQATALILALYLRLSEALRLCHDQVVPPVRVAGHPQVWSIFLHTQEQGMSPLKDTAQNTSKTRN